MRPAHPTCSRGSVPGGPHGVTAVGPCVLCACAPAQTPAVLRGARFETTVKLTVASDGQRPEARRGSRPSPVTVGWALWATRTGT